MGIMAAQRCAVSVHVATTMTSVRSSQGAEKRLMTVTCKSSETGNGKVTSNIWWIEVAGHLAKDQQTYRPTPRPLPCVSP